MRVLTLDDIAKMEPGETVPAVKATVKAIFDTYRGSGAKGAYTVQSFVLTDGTNELRASAWDRADLPVKWKGKQVHIMSKSDNGKLSGLALKEKEYQGKARRELHINPCAEIVQSEVYQGAEAKRAEEDEIPGAEVPARPPVAATAPSNDFKLACARLYRLRQHAEVIADALNRWREPALGDAYGAAETAALATTFFIQMVRDNLTPPQGDPERTPKAEAQPKDTEPPVDF